MNNENIEQTYAHPQEGQQQLTDDQVRHQLGEMWTDFVDNSLPLIRNGFKIKDLQEALTEYCGEEEQVVALLSDEQRETLNNNPNAEYLVKNNNKGKVISVVVAEPAPVNGKPDRAIVTH